MAQALLLKRANTSRPSGHWGEDDYDVLSEGEVVGRIMKVISAPRRAAWRCEPVTRINDITIIFVLC
jgi:hypothetical protein